MTTRTKAPTRIDLGCGQRKREDHFGVDVMDVEGVDLVWDLADMPWPFEDDSVEEIVASHLVEHLTPVGGPNDGLIAFMNEAYRICAPGAKVEIIHPYLMSKRAFQDPMHVRFIPENTWTYFNAEWRERERLDHYPITADFHIEGIANGWQPGWELRSDAARQFHAEHGWNVITDLAVTLRALKK